MKEFADLLDALLFTTSTLGKRKLMARYFRERPDPERGYALAALTQNLSFTTAKPALIRELIADRVDPILYSLSRDYVGDMAETVSLMWPEKTQTLKNYFPTLNEIVEALETHTRKEIKEDLVAWLDVLDATSRWALLKLITGNIRIGVSARLAKLALSDAFSKNINEIEEIWHGLEMPYISLYAWLEGKTDKPQITDRAIFMPMMLSHPLDRKEFEERDLSRFQIELKWDGIRVQVVRTTEHVSLFSRTGDDITRTFPDLRAELLAIDESEFVLDGELLATANGKIAPFNSLQQRLNRKIVSAQMLQDYPAHIRLYDMLMDRGHDIRSEPLDIRRSHLEQFQKRHGSSFIDLSSVITAHSLKELELIREKARTEAVHGVEGLMLKKRDSPYVGGRPKGYWYKWKRNTLTLDCVLMYAQRGSGKRSSFYSDYTFGVWQGNPDLPATLVPVGKAYSGFTDAELVALDKWIRSNTLKRFGPVREVPPQLVMEIEFDSIQPSSRHKSGLAMRFPRVHRIRWDKPANEADTLQNAQALAA